MFGEIMMKIVSSVISFSIPAILGFLIAKIVEYKNLNKALKCLLRSSITKIYYEYKPKGYIPQYERENVIYLHDQYKNMKGNSYVDTIFPEILNLPIKDEK